MSSPPADNRPVKAGADEGGGLVVRSDVVPGKPYREYRQVLRHDFRYQCAYCGMTEREAQGIRMTIDHYEPRLARPDLENDYCNLMYSCDECNLRKGDRSPPQEARNDGFRFFRPDQDLADDHFEEKGIRVSEKSNTGYYSIMALDLNRQSLRRLRELRIRAEKCEASARVALAALRRFHIDQLPPILRSRALRAIHNAALAGEQISGKLDELMSGHARSPMLDADAEAVERRGAQAANLKSVEANYLGSWRGPRSTRRR